MWGIGSTGLGITGEMATTDVIESPDLVVRGVSGRERTEMRKYFPIQVWA